MTTNNIAITSFAAGRHWRPDFAGTKVLDLTAGELVEIANAAIEAGAELQPGYMPACKHLFLENPSTTRCGYAAITPDNEGALRSGYEARRPTELPVLGRFFPAGTVEAPQATYLDLVLYSRDHLLKEAKTDAEKVETERELGNAEWGIVSVNAEMQAAESPMAPTTQLRNALGKDQGGSGVPINEAAYRAAVEFWAAHAVIK